MITPPCSAAICVLPRVGSAVVARAYAKCADYAAFSVWSALHFAFVGLGARYAHGDAFTDNHASRGVSRALGYAENGVVWGARRGEAAPMQRFTLAREAWRRT